MYKFIIIIILFNLLPAVADDFEPVLLQGHTKLELQESQLRATKPVDYELKYEKRTFPFVQNDNLYSSKTTSYTKEKKLGDFSFGSKTDSVFYPDKYSQTNTYYTKYQKNRFALSTSYKNTALTSFEQYRNGTFMFSPEYKLNNKVSLQSIYSTSFLDRSRKNELLFNIRPFQDDRMNFNVGASQIYSTSITPARSQLNFSTKFNF